MEFHCWVRHEMARQWKEALSSEGWLLEHRADVQHCPLISSSTPGACRGDMIIQTPSNIIRTLEIPDGCCYYYVLFSEVGKAWNSSSMGYDGVSSVLNAAFEMAYRMFSVSNALQQQKRSAFAGYACPRKTPGAEHLDHCWGIRVLLACPRGLKSLGFSRQKYVE